MDLDNRLVQFENDFNELPQKEFDNFNALEVEYCRLINEATQIRNFIVSNPQVADENTIKLLTNQPCDISQIPDKFKTLLHLRDLYMMLVKKYKEEVKILLDEKRYDQAINIYEQLFKFTNNYWYKKEIANIQFKIFNNVELALRMYKELEPYINKSPEFWWQLSDLFDKKDNQFKRLCAMQTAINLELQKEG